jgi:hypothetical protein
MIFTRHALRACHSCKRGNVAVIFALSAMPVLGIAGLALDYSRISAARDRLQSSVDAAIVAAAASGGEVAQMQTLVADFVEVNFGEPGVKVETTVNSHDMRVSATYALNLAVLAAIGKPEAMITAQAELQSEALLRGGAVQSRDGVDEGGQLEEMLRKLPPHVREALERQLAAAMRKRSNRQDGQHFSR